MRGEERKATSPSLLFDPHLPSDHGYVSCLSCLVCLSGAKADITFLTFPFSLQNALLFLSFLPTFLRHWGPAMPAAMLLLPCLPCPFTIILSPSFPVLVMLLLFSHVHHPCLLFLKLGGRAKVFKKVKKSRVSGEEMRA